MFVTKLKKMFLLVAVRFHSQFALGYTYNAAGNRIEKNTVKAVLITTPGTYAMRKVIPWLCMKKRAPPPYRTPVRNAPVCLSA
jgi:YD repeat-containing protein